MNRSIAHLRYAAVWCECSPGWGGSLQRPAPPTGCDLPGTAAHRPAERTRLPAGGVDCTPSTGNIPCDTRCLEPSSPGRCCRSPCYTLHIWCQTTWKKHEDDRSFVRALNLMIPTHRMLCTCSTKKMRVNTFYKNACSSLQSGHIQPFNFATIYTHGIVGFSS